jgi:hypothetical protein
VGAWYWIGVCVGIGVAVGVFQAAFWGTGRSSATLVPLETVAIGVVIGWLISGSEPGGWIDRIGGGAGAALGLLGAVLGTVAAYVAAIGYAWDNPLDSLSELSSIPTWNLAIIIVGLPLIAAAGGWLLAGREPAAIARRPLE